MKQLFVYCFFLLSRTIVFASARKSILLARKHQTVPKLRHGSCALRDEPWISLYSPDLFLGSRTVACWSSWVERQSLSNLVRKAQIRRSAIHKKRKQRWQGRSCFPGCVLELANSSTWPNGRSIGIPRCFRSGSKGNGSGPLSDTALRLLGNWPRLSGSCHSAWRRFEHACGMYDNKRAQIFCPYQNPGTSKIATVTH